MRSRRAAPDFSGRPVLFDLDGTLADSAPGITAAINATLRGLGAPEVPAADLLASIGPPLHETFGRLLIDRELTSAEIEDVVADYRRRYAAGMVAGSVPYEGVRELLSALRDQGRVLAVATSKAQSLAQALLDGHDLSAPFAAICGPVPPARETKTQTISKALAALGPRADGAVMVGDRHHDIRGAVENGVPAIGVLYGFGARDELEMAGADAIAADVSQLARLLGVGEKL